MKLNRKRILRIAVGVVAFAMIALVVIAFSRDSIVKFGAETFGPKWTGGSVRVEDIELHPLDGTLALEGVALGNPPGFTTNPAIVVRRMFLDVQPGSLASGKIVVRRAELNGADITIEPGMKGDNLETLFRKLRRERESERKLQIDHLSIKNVRLRFLLPMFGTRAAAFSLPDLVVEDLGAGTNGVTSAEILALLLKRVSGAVGAAAASAFGGTTGSPQDPTIEQCCATDATTRTPDEEAVRW